MERREERSGNLDFRSDVDSALLKNGDGVS